MIGIDSEVEEEKVGGGGGDSYYINEFILNYSNLNRMVLLYSLWHTKVPRI